MCVSSVKSKCTIIVVVVGPGCKSCGYYFVNGPHIVHTGWSAGAAGGN